MTGGAVAGTTPSRPAPLVHEVGAVRFVNVCQHPPALAGPEVHSARRPTSGQRIPLQTREPKGSGVRKLHAQQGSVPSPAAPPFPMPALRRSSRLARRHACCAQSREGVSRSRMHELTLHHVVPRLPASETTVRTPRVHGRRVAHTHGAPSHSHRPTLERAFRRRRSQRLHPRSSSPVDRVLWYPSNILWLQVGVWVGHPGSAQTAS